MAMQKAFYESTPAMVDYGCWHLPYIQLDDILGYTLEQQKKISAGRCARVSYLTHDGKRDPLEDIKLADKLANAKPMHPSPLEHVATPDPNGQNQLGNFDGWMQYRHSFYNETIKTFIPNYK